MIASPSLMPTVYVPSGESPERVVVTRAEAPAIQEPAVAPKPRKSHVSSQNRAAILPAAAIALTIVASACGGDEAEASTHEAPVTVLVGPEAMAVAATTTLSTGPLLSGSLVAERTAHVRAEVSGSVVQVLVDPGAQVERGMSLAKIDDRAINDSYLSARSGLTAAQTAADLAARERERATKLAGAGAISDRDVENARRADLTARTVLDDAKARLAAAQKQLDATNVLSPYAGIVSERAVNPGDVVAPGAPLFTIVDPATMRLEAAVPAEQLAQVRVGAPVRFAVTGYPGRTFEGRVSSINPAADPQTRQVRLFVRIPNAGNRLVAGLFASGRVASESRDVLAVPATAIDERGLSPVALRLKNGVTERVDVTVGARDDATGLVEVLSGLAAGDTVLTGAALGISTGTPLKVNVPSDQPRDTTRN